MTWRFLYRDALKNEEKDTAIEPREVPIEGSDAQLNVNEQEEVYQKKLFENDLYVWSLMLLKNNNV